MFAATGNDWLILDVTKVSDAIGIQGHHAYGGPGQDTFQFKNIEENSSPIVGRLDDFDPTSDRIFIEDTEIDLTDLPKSITLPGGEVVEVRVVNIEHPEFIAENLGAQHFLAIGDDAFYALEGARDLQNGTSGLTGEERHFLKPDALETLRTAETVQYENPKNFVPREFYEDREDDLNLNWNQPGEEVFADTGEKTAAHMFGSKSNPDAPSSDGEQVMTGSTGDDVIDANNGNDTVFGGDGNDLIAGGIDNDVLHGESGDDMIWGGDGDDTLNGGLGNDYLHGGRGDDSLNGGEGHDTLFSGEGNDTLEGGGGEDAINRFHFYEEGGDDTVTDFKVGLDQITLQDDIDPLTVELYENEDGNTVLNYAQTGSVELRGVALKDFRDAAEIRAEEGNPIITVTPDPEEEMLQELRVENGFYGDEEPPDLMVEGVQYGATAFREPEPGGYTYVSEQEIDDGTGSDEPAVEEDEGDELDPLPEIPLIDEEEEEEEARPIDEEEEAGQGSCFVATAAYRDPWHPDVVFLRAFRDQWLVHRAWGRAFVTFYWWVGPKMAAPVRRSAWLAFGFRVLISGIVRTLQKGWASGRI
ncbi:calcium-binding protein [Sediminimonas sp.]|uniref:calcium-binding protein n=1 Tax=Sediminimonas sp. TaxID=2823379 RepID=UPI0025D6E70D|nr:calcium-binding protein [Sediminimonas sp.]